MDNERIYTEAFALDGKKIWYSTMCGNMLYCLDLDSSENRFVDVFPEIEWNRTRLHTRAIKKNNVVYFIPDSAPWIHIFDLKNEQLRAVKIEKQLNVRFIDAFEYAGKIYLLSNGERFSICCFDMYTEKCETIELNGCEFDGEIMKYPVQIGHKFYMACSGYPQVIVFDCETSKIEPLVIKECNDGIGTIVYDGRFFWSSTKRGFLQWSLSGDIIKKIYQFPHRLKTWRFISDRESAKNEIVLENGFYDGGKKVEYPFWLSCAYGDKVLFFSRMVNMNVEVCQITGNLNQYAQINEMESAETLAREHRVTCNHYFGECIEEKLYISSSCTGNFYVISPNGVRSYELKRDNKDRTCWLRQRGESFKSSVFFENETIDLLEYISCIQLSGTIVRDVVEHSNGNLIYKAINEEKR